MIGYVRQITPFELAQFRRNPGSVKRLLDDETMSRFSPEVHAIAERIERSRVLFGVDRIDRELQAELQKAMQAPGAVDVNRISENRHKGLCLEKSWQHLHYLITGKLDDAPPPLGNAILGGTPIGDDVGYGPARYLTPQQVREVADALAAIPREELVRRSAAEMPLPRGIYGVDPSGQEDDLEETLEYFDELVQYYSEAAEQGNAVFLYLR
jgi:hypothetical protein